MKVAPRLIKMKMFHKLGRIVLGAFAPKYLIYTNMGISMGLGGVGDVLEQTHEYFIDKLQEWDPARTNRMTISGLPSGALTHYWYKYLDKRMPGKTIEMVVKKVVMDQILYAPLAIVTLLATLAMLEGVSYAEFVLKVKQKGWRLYMADWAVWPPAQFFNFYFIPSKYRMLYDSIISLGFDVYTSYVMHAIPLQKPQEHS